MKLEVDVKNHRTVGNALRQGLKDGLEESGEWLMDMGEDEARDIVMQNDRVWNKKVKRGFSSNSDPLTNRNTYWQGTILNAAPHAEIVERGLAPAGEITGADPSVQDIIGWVDDTLSAADYDGPSPGASGGDDDDDSGGKGITDDGFSVSNYRTVDEVGIHVDQFESDNPRIASLSNGDDVIWKSHDTGSEGKDSAIRHEVVWSRAQERRDWDLGPKSRLDSHEVNGEEVEATIQEFIHDSSEVFENVRLGTHEVEGQQDRHEFFAEHREMTSRTATLDYLLGNNDRPATNVRFTPDGEPRAIDNGGKTFEEGLEQRSLYFLGEQTQYSTANDPEALHEQNLKHFEAVEAAFEEIADDLEYRKELVEDARLIHGEDSNQYQRLREVIGEEIGEGHFLEENEQGVPRYQQDINEIVDRLEGHIETYDDPDDDPDDDPKETIITDIDDAIDDMF